MVFADAESAASSAFYSFYSAQSSSPLQAAKAQADEAADSSVLFHQPIGGLRAEAFDKVALTQNSSPPRPDNSWEAAANTAAPRQISVGKAGAIF